MRFFIFVATIVHMTNISGATLTGQVSNDSGAVSGAIIYEHSWGSAGHTVLGSTDATGQFSIELTAGTHEIFAESGSAGDLARSQKFKIPVSDSQTTDIRLEIAEVVTISGEYESAGLAREAIAIRHLDTGADAWIAGYGSSGDNFSFDVPKGRYSIEDKIEGSDTVKQFYLSSVSVDASSGSVSGLLIKKRELPGESRFNKVPPNGTLISFGVVNDYGIRQIIGDIGAVSGVQQITATNLQTGQTNVGSSGSNGSFSIDLFAPDGASVMIQNSRLHNTAASPPAGTVVRIPVSEEQSGAFSTGQKLGERFDVSRSVELKVVGAKDPGQVWLTGNLDSKIWSAGTSGTLEGTATIYSRNLASKVPTLGTGQIFLDPVFDSTGKQTIAGPEQSSSDLTVSNLPIERSYLDQGNYQESFLLGEFSLSGYQQLSDRSGTASWSGAYTVPEEVPDGIYQLVLGGKDLPNNTIVKDIDSDTKYFGDLYYEPGFNHLSSIGGVALIEIGSTTEPRLFPALLMNEFSNGSRGVTAIEDKNEFAIAPHIITNSKDLIIPLIDPVTEKTKIYNLEPFVPLTASSNKHWLHPPTIPFKFPSGNLKITVTDPSGAVSDLGNAPFKGSYIQKPTTVSGKDGSSNSNAPDGHLGLTTLDPRFETSFSQYGKHTVTLTGSIEDVFGDLYDVSGTFEIYVAETLDIETGVFPSTPFEVGNHFSPAVVVQPGVPAAVEITVAHFPKSDTAQKVESKISGQANRFGYFMPSTQQLVKFENAGEYRVDYTVSFTDDDGVLWMGSRTWGSVVETPNSLIIAHGSRGAESESTENRQWYLMNDSGVVNAHFQFPYNRGDISWMTNSVAWNAAMVAAVTLHDTGGTLNNLLASRTGISSIDFSFGEIILRTTNANWRLAPYSLPNSSDNHWGYYYSGAARPGVAIRELINGFNGYWRFDTPYNFQLGNGPSGDNQNDFKFLFGGSVYRVPDQDFYHYGAYGSLWVMLPASDALGGRVFPPFQGAAGGQSGGPIMTLKGEEIDIFFHPGGVRAGTILEVGDYANFSGQIAPTLDSKVNITVTLPSGAVRTITGQANKVGYFYDPTSDFKITEAGLHTAKVTVTHDGITSAGQVDPPYPTGGVLGTTAGSFSFYAVTSESHTLDIPIVKSNWVDPPAGALPFVIAQPTGLTNVELYQTAVMPGFVLEQSKLASLTYNYNASTLAEDFPNLDLYSNDVGNGTMAGADTVTMSFLLAGTTSTGTQAYQARQVLLQGSRLLGLDNEAGTTATATMSLNNSSYSEGDRMTVDMSVEGSGVTEMYIALVFPSGDFVTLGYPLEVSGTNAILTYLPKERLNGSNSYPILDIDLPPGLATGTYTWVGLLTNKGADILDQSKWVSITQKEFVIQ